MSVTLTPALSQKERGLYRKGLCLSRVRNTSVAIFCPIRYNGQQSFTLTEVFMRSKIFHRSVSFVSACCVTLAVLGASFIQAAEFKPFLTVQLAGPSTLVSIAERVAAVSDMPDMTQAVAMAAPYKNLPGVNATGAIGLAIQANEDGPFGVDILLSLPISDFATFTIPGMEEQINGIRAMAQRQGNQYTFATPFGTVSAQQRQGFLIVATEDAAEFAATVDPKTLFAEVSEFTLGIHTNLENITEEAVEMMIGSLSLLLATQGIDPDNLNVSDQLSEVFETTSAVTGGITIDPRTLNITGSAKTVAKRGSTMADKFSKSQEAQANTTLGAFLPDTPQTIFAWHYLNYFTDTEIKTMRETWTLIGEGLLEGLHDSMEYGDADEKQLKKVIAAAEAFMEYGEADIEFLAREKLLDSTFWFDSSGLLMMAISTDKTAEAMALDEKFFGKLIAIFGGPAGKIFIEAKTKRNYETVAGYSISCIPNLFAGLPPGMLDLPDELKEVIKNVPINLFWAVKENEVLAYAVGLDFDKTEQALKTAMAGTPTPPKQTAMIAVKPFAEFVLNTVMPLIPGLEESNLEEAREAFAPFLEMKANTKIVAEEEYSDLSYTQKGQVPGELVTAFVKMMVKGPVMVARGAARRMQCANNMMHLGLSLHNYHDANAGLPPLYTVDAEGKPLHSWRVLLLPYMEQQALFAQIRLNEPWDSPHNRQFHNAVVPQYSCPDNPLVAPGKACAYVAINGALRPALPDNGQRPRERDSFAHWQDGTSNQFAFIEVKEPFNWMDPTADITLDELAKGVNKTGRVGSFHPGGGCIACLGDGAVRFITDAVDSALLRALGDPRDGQGRGSMLP